MYDSQYLKEKNFRRNCIKIVKLVPYNPELWNTSQSSLMLQTGTPLQNRKAKEAMEKCDTCVLRIINHKDITELGTWGTDGCED